VLGLEELNAQDGPRQYEDIAIELGKNPAKLKSIRVRLIGTCTQRNPMHPYWDVPRYVKNFEEGLRIVWQRYLSGLPPDHITVEESEETKRGTYDHTLLINPPEGKVEGVSDEL
jgi:protein O-GlcNAc transferase